MYDSFRRYQSALIEQFDRLAEEFHFEVIDARPGPTGDLRAVCVRRSSASLCSSKAPQLSPCVRRARPVCSPVPSAVPSRRSECLSACP